MTTHQPGPRATLAFFSLLATLTSATACDGTVLGPTSGTGGGAGGTANPGTCPADQPSPGSPCASEGLSCTYTTCFYGAQAVVSCSGGAWTDSPDDIGDSLPCPCSSNATQDACASAGCRWLVPGCGEAAFTPGCFDETDCTLGSTGCLGGLTCTKVDADPCWDSTCAACSGLVANVCTGPG